MKTDSAFELALQEMQRLAGERTAAKWLHQLGLRQAAADMARRDDIAFAGRLLREGHSRPQVRDRLVARGHSRTGAYRVLHDALAQLRPPVGTQGHHDAGIET